MSDHGVTYSKHDAHAGDHVKRQKSIFDEMKLGMLKIKSNVPKAVKIVEEEEPLQYHEHHKELNKLIRVANKVKARAE